MTKPDWILQQGDYGVPFREHCSMYGFFILVNCPSYESKKISDLYKLHEGQKIKVYGNRVTQLEKASSTPLVYSTHGGTAPQADIFNRRLAKLIAEKRNEEYRDVITHLRTCVRFTLLRSVLVALRGVRGRSYRQPKTPLSFVEFGLIPEAESYDGPL